MLAPTIPTIAITVTTILGTIISRNSTLGITVLVIAIPLTIIVVITKLYRIHTVSIHGTVILGITIVRTTIREITIFKATIPGVTLFRAIISVANISEIIILPNTILATTTHGTSLLQLMY
ncbi:hypothetical protein HZH68_007318 [Vespula germanica]|uniref:Uncharacterized protein n=1 Tax=Vespula germanica TaxID=30212 RepID=A0A834K7B6_VESGE|nr:hypothetical protein HZH68_007318 [Vespula germanica]